ncbi:MAG: polyphosphate kinase 2 family protein [Phycisphaerales bacterium]|nr:polyphosphate kinase 2 family protein [Phycisphaerales bacterium]
MAKPNKLKPVRQGSSIKLADYNPADKSGFWDEPTTHQHTEQYTRQIGELQSLLYAQGTQALLIVLQGMDTAGKDGTIRRVFDHVNPMGVHAVSFKSPSELERQHDFLWRIHRAVPPRGSLGIFNRSHYEDVLIARVHAEHLLPPALQHHKHIWRDRFARINDFERLLVQTNTRVIKFFLHISKQEQKLRFLARQQDPTKNWKLSKADFTERPFWDHYQRAYEKALSNTSTSHAPWYIVPSNHKWVRDYHVARIIYEALRDLNPQPRKQSDPSLIKLKFK